MTENKIKEAVEMAYPYPLETALYGPIELEKIKNTIDRQREAFIAGITSDITKEHWGGKDWISVQHEKPYYYKTIWIYCDGNYVLGLRTNSRGMDFYKKMEQHEILRNLTHWMPLP